MAMRCCSLSAGPSSPFMRCKPNCPTTRSRICGQSPWPPAVASASLIQSMEQLAERAKADPAGARLGFSGIGGRAHLAGAMSEHMSDAAMTRNTLHGQRPGAGGRAKRPIDVHFRHCCHNRAADCRRQAARSRCFQLCTFVLVVLLTMLELGYEGFTVKRFQHLSVLRPKGMSAEGTPRLLSHGQERETAFGRRDAAKPKREGHDADWGHAQGDRAFQHFAALSCPHGAGAAANLCRLCGSSDGGA